ncbi:MAG: hypothetical protein HY675_29400 [Chloroflexi bacterium]|nr:hypothetical protein [Chloroflexota bacterium]
MPKTSISGLLCTITIALVVLAACASAAPTPTPAKPVATTGPAVAPAPAPTVLAVATPVPKLAATPAAAAKPALPAIDEKAVADFYRGKTVKIIVGTSAGGGYDTYSRLIARFIGKFIPGNPNMIVENMPGGGTLVATNFVYKAAPKDGTVIINFSGGLVNQQLVGAQGVEFDAPKFQYLGVPSVDQPLLVVTKASGIAKLDDTIGPNGKQLVIGGTAPGSPQVALPVAVREVLGAKIKMVTGYDGTTQIRLAMEQGEVDGYVNNWTSLRSANRAELDSGKWLILARFTEEPIKDLPNLPGILTFAKNDEQRQLLRFGTISPNQFGRLYAVGPDVPKDRAMALSAAFAKTMADKEFLAEAEKAKLDISALGGDQIGKLIVEYLAMPAAIKTKLQQMPQ